MSNNDLLNTKNLYSVLEEKFEDRNINCEKILENYKTEIIKNKSIHFEENLKLQEQNENLCKEI